jgi:dipeptidase E
VGQCPPCSEPATLSFVAQILAIGGGGFQLEDDPSPIDAYLLTIPRRAKPKICLLATPSGDCPDYIGKFYAAFPENRCAPSHLPFFAREPQAGAIDVRDRQQALMAQDIIFVSGGNTRAALAIWREWGIDAILQRALNSGVILAGMSAGAMCWFQHALTDTYWEPGFRPLAALGFLHGGCRVHYNDSTEQRGRLHDALRAGVTPSAIAIDDYAAVLFRDGKVDRVVSWHQNATAYQLSISDSEVIERNYSSESIAR